MTISEDGGAPIVDQSNGAQPDWHVLAADAVAERLGTGAQGITRDEAAQRLERHGPNRLKEEERESPLKVFLRQFASPVIFILVIAAAVTLVLGEYIDASVIGAVLALNAIIGFTQERQAEASVRALMQLVSPHARVLREGREWEVASADVVPGDVVLLESGARVPADIRLTTTTSLSIDESLLTGESVPVAKRSETLEQAEVDLGDRTNMAYSGSIVATGRGRGYVVATGMETQLGQIAGYMRTEETPETPLQHRVNQLARLIGIGVGVAAAGSFALGLALGESASDMFVTAVALAVSAVPEGLPVAFTITLALGVRRMAGRNAIVRRLPAVETLGSTTVVGSDKTGTLTENRMTVREVWSGGHLESIPIAEEALGDPSGEGAAILRTNPGLRLSFLAGVLASEAVLYVDEEGEYETEGDPTESALLLAASRMGVEAEEARGDYAQVGMVPFESDRQYSAAICEHDGEYLAFVKGAPERVVAMCERWQEGEEAAPIDPDRVLDAAREMASRGLRVLATAYRSLGKEPPENPDFYEPHGLTFLGLHGMQDPPREGVREAINGCKRAGMRVVMITGDHALTARAIALELGIAGHEDEEVLAGEDVEQMEDDALREAVLRVNVFARVSPEHKLRVVRALRERGDVVAVTGDGVNDAPALRAADIGIAMGERGTDVAREAAAMVLTDDNFVSIYAAVEEGRVTFDNVRKVTFFLLSTGVAEVFTILAALVLGWQIPFVAAQLLWLNLITNGLQDVALAFEPGEKGVLQRPPRPPREGILSKLLWERLGVSGVVMAAGTLFMFDWRFDGEESLEAARTVALTTMVIFQTFQLGNSRSEYLSVFRKSPFSNPFLFVATGAALSIHVAALYLPPTQYVLRVEPISLTAWMQIVAVASSILVAVEIHKWFRRGWRPSTMTTERGPRT